MKPDSNREKMSCSVSLMVGENAVGSWLQQLLSRVLVCCECVRVEVRRLKGVELFQARTPASGRPLNDEYLEVSALCLRRFCCALAQF